MGKTEYNKIFEDKIGPLKKITERIIKIEEILQNPNLPCMSSSNASEPLHDIMHNYYYKGQWCTTDPRGWGKLCSGTWKRGPESPVTCMSPWYSRSFMFKPSEMILSIVCALCIPIHLACTFKCVSLLFDCFSFTACQVVYVVFICSKQFVFLFFYRLLPKRYSASQWRSRDELTHCEKIELVSILPSPGRSEDHTISEGEKFILTWLSLLPECDNVVQIFQYS